MNLIKVEVKIDIDNEQQLALLNTFLNSLRGLSGEAVGVTGKTVDLKKTTPAASTTAQPAKAEKAVEETKEDVETVETVTLDDVSKVIATKVQEHREKIKSKLTEMGVSRAGELDGKGLKQFHDFLLEL